MERMPSSAVSSSQFDEIHDNNSTAEYINSDVNGVISIGQSLTTLMSAERKA
jgi:hypothetical protein